MTAAPAQLALAELTRRRAQASAQLAQGRVAPETAARHVALWAGIAAWFGAVLPDDLRPYGDWQLWTDHAPPAMLAAEWRALLAAELRRAALAQLARAEAEPTPQHLTRARALLRLDRDLSTAAALPPIGAATPDERKAA